MGLAWGQAPLIGSSRKLSRSANAVMSENTTPNEDSSPVATPETAVSENDQNAAPGSNLKAVDTGRRVDLSQNTAKRPTRRRKGPSAGGRQEASPADSDTASNAEATGTEPQRTAKANDSKRKDKKAPRADKKAQPQTRQMGGSGHLDAKLFEQRERRTTFDASGDFAAMLAESEDFGQRDIRVGDKMDATVASIGNESVFFDLGMGRDGWMPVADLMDGENVTVQVGDRVKAFVISIRDGVQLSTKIAAGGVDLGLLEDAKNNGIPVQGKVSGVNKGGLQIELGGGARGFCPTGQADLGFIEDVKIFEGQTLSFLVREIREGGRNVVLSRRALLKRDRAEKAQKLMETLEVGQLRKGIVTRIQPFGAFVDLGGIDGLVPVSELSWGHVQDPADVVSTGEEVEVEIRRIEEDPKNPGKVRIGLSLRAAQGDPWERHSGQLQVGSTLEGKVSRLENFGAFVMLFEGIEGLVHISELSFERVRVPSDIVQPGEPVSVRVLEVDAERRRISLSLKEAREARPKSTEKDAAPQLPAPARGKMVSGVVERIERYGVFVKLDDGQTALLPGVETGTPRGTDYSRAFPIGTQLSLLVIDVDERGRIKVSKTAREQAEERAELSAYNQSQQSSGGGLGTFADLLKGKFGK